MKPKSKMLKDFNTKLSHYTDYKLMLLEYKTEKTWWTGHVVEGGHPSYNLLLRTPHYSF